MIDIEKKHKLNILFKIMTGEYSKDGDIETNFYSNLMPDSYLFDMVEKMEAMHGRASVEIIESKVRAIAFKDGAISDEKRLTKSCVVTCGDSEYVYDKCDMDNERDDLAMTAVADTLIYLHIVALESRIPVVFPLVWARLEYCSGPICHYCGLDEYIYIRDSEGVGMGLVCKPDLEKDVKKYQKMGYTTLVLHNKELKINDQENKIN